MDFFGITQYGIFSLSIDHHFATLMVVSLFQVSASRRTKRKPR